MYGEVVVTRSNKRVLDIGLKVAPGKIRCRYSGHPTDGKWYGGNEETLKSFKPVGERMTEEEWEELTCGKFTSEICELLGIPTVFEEEDDENHRTIFKEIRAMLDRYDELVFIDNPNEHEKDFEWFDDYIFNMAKALNKELPDVSKIAKILCIMNDDGIKIQIT